MQQLPPALAPLAAYAQFIVYKLAPKKDEPGKMTKLPIDVRTGRMPLKDSGASSIWTDAETALAAAQVFGPSYGVGFSFAESDPFYFLDIDNCLLPNNTWSPLAQHLMATLPGAAIEISQSGRGLHIIGTGTPPEHGCKNEHLGLEFYHTERFVALTGYSAQGDVRTDHSHVLPWLVSTYFNGSDGMGSSSKLQAWEAHLNGPVPEWNGPKDNAELVKRAIGSKSAVATFGGKASFADLWYAQEEALAATYPDGNTYDASSADAALAQHLAFWTGRDAQRIHDIMQGSSLRRDKWEERADYYLPVTIGAACARQREVLQDKAPQALTIEYDTPDGTLETAATLVNGATYLSIENQLDLFKGCTYVTDAHKILIPGGDMLNAERFRVRYGGFTFPMDNGNERHVRNAWECFTESQAFRGPRADSTCFRPALPPGAVVREAGRLLVNAWWPIDTPRAQGDATPFLLHLTKVLPDTRDQTILLSYMAACVQHKGVKFQWAPLLQGVEGNGKTLFTRCVAEAIGARYTHFPPAHEINEKFNSWLFNMLFIGVEDIYVPEHKMDIFEILKGMITGDRLAKRAMQTDQVMHDVCCNFLFNSNHKAAIRKTRNDRRIAPFYTAQQSAEDLRRDGMVDDYFPELYAWLRGGGYAIVTELLYTYQIPPEFNPAGSCNRAPNTSATELAIENGLGRVEQEVLEAIDREDMGFRGGWISSIFFERLLDRIGSSRFVPPNKRRELLQNIGYDWVAGLPNGKVNNILMPDAGKPKLYVKKDSPLNNIHSPAEIARAYSDAQQET